MSDHLALGKSRDQNGNYRKRIEKTEKLNHIHADRFRFKKHRQQIGLKIITNLTARRQSVQYFPSAPVPHLTKATQTEQTKQNNLRTDVLPHQQQGRTRLNRKGYPRKRHTVNR